MHEKESPTNTETYYFVKLTFMIYYENEKGWCERVTLGM